MDVPRELRTTPVCVDARMLAAGGTGVSTFARGLVAASRRLSEQPTLLTATKGGPIAKWLDMLRRRPRAVSNGVAADGWSILHGADIFRRAHAHFGLTGRLYPLRCAGPPGIMHWTYPVPMVLEGWINAYTVHDTIPLDHPELTSIDPGRHRAVLRAVMRAGELVTVSDAAASAIRSALGATRVTNIGQAVDPGDEPREAAPAELARGYLLVVGTLEPRKNITTILAAYRDSGVDLPLVFAGPDGWRCGPILADIAATPGAIRMPYMARAAILGLIEGARALLFPSLAEGFGLPMVEAMALGTPVLTSDRGALAEVAGGAALTVDPHNPASIKAAMIRLASDRDLVGALAQRGRVRAAAFSMERFVERLSAFYGDALRRGSEVRI